MLLVTRPREQALEWVQRLVTLGVTAQALPLLGIEWVTGAPEPARARQACWAGHYDAVMFVSPNAVSGFFRQAASEKLAPWPATTLAAAPGPGTAAALVAHGVPEAAIIQPPAHAAQFDSESLWPELSSMPWMGRRVLVVRGEGGREWLIDRWREAGAAVHPVSVYRQAAPQPTPDEAHVLRQIVAQPEGAIWLFSSSQAVSHWPALLQRHQPGLDWAAFAARTRALATHPRIQAAAQVLGLNAVHLCRPDLQGVVASYNGLNREH